MMRSALLYDSLDTKVGSQTASRAVEHVLELTVATVRNPASLRDLVWVYVRIQLGIM